MKILKEIYNYRQMIYSLVNKELKVRYKGSILGFFWTFLNPLLQLIVYTIVFSVILKSSIKNFHIYLFVGLVPWIFFTTCIQAGSVSVVANKDLVKKIYFPRIVLPIATVNAAFMNMVYTMIVVILTVSFSEVGLSWYVLLLPVIMILQYIMVLGITFIFAALNVFFRDLEYILNIVIMAWFYATPIVYSIDMVPAEYKGIFLMNPMTSIIIFYREILYYKKLPDFSFFGSAVLYSIIMISCFSKIAKKLCGGTIMKEIAISVENVEKSFKIYKDKGFTLKERILFFKSRNAYVKNNILRGISFDIEKGDILGIVGKNGSGKSTLLKLITKIIYPDSGSIKTNGKVSSLIELGAGFHPDMTGRENIYINASIYGLTKKEIDSKLDTIIKFSELEEFIDSPIRTYSSGMYMRLAFSVAINVEAEILLIDEILSVGDANFQAKCFRKMQELKDSGITIVIVSHDLHTMEKLCNKVIWIESGKIKRSGIPNEVLKEYIEYTTES